MFSVLYENIYIILTQILFGFVLSLIIILYKNKFKKLINLNFYGPQKIHETFVPRFGGICFFFAVIFFASFYNIKNIEMFYFILIASLPAFFSGVCEDITNLITPKIRLMASIISGILFVTLLDVKITYVGIPFIDYALGSVFLSVFITVLSISLLIQAYNIIDGINGLAIINFLTVLWSVFFISHEVGDYFLRELSMCFFFGITGIFLLNFPFGKIFLGDGGAYFIGTISAFIVIMLTQKNINVHPVVALLIIIYPVYELIRSFLRRLFMGISFIFKPDDKHLHSYIYKKNLLKINKSKKYINSFSTIETSFIPVFSSCWSCFFYNDWLYLYIGVILSIFFFEIKMYKIRHCNNNST